MIIENIEKYIENQGISYYEIENRLNVGRGTISKAIKEKKSIGTKIVENFLLTYPNINPEWLLTGRGEMIRKAEEKSTKISGNNNVAHSYNNATIIHQNEEIAQLKNQLKEKDKMIKELKNIIIQIKK